MAHKRVYKMATAMAGGQKRASGMELGSNASSSTCKSPRQVTKATFMKWKREFEKDSPSLTWLKVDMDQNDKRFDTISAQFCIPLKAKGVKLAQSTDEVEEIVEYATSYVRTSELVLKVTEKFGNSYSHVLIPTNG